jgi:photosystem II stability/assembly factor-like uncharacterized protein
MSDLQEALAAEARRREPDGQPLFVDMLARRRRRQTVRRGAAAAVLAAVAVAGGTAVALSVRGGDGTQRLAVGAPSRGPAGPSPTAAAAPAAPPCPASVLGAAATGGGPVSNGFTGATILITNTGRKPCSLPNAPSGLADADGPSPVPLPVQADTSPRPPQTVPPGRALIFDIESVRLHGSANCLRPAPARLAAPRRLQITVPGSGAVIVELTSAGTFTLACWPVHIGPFTSEDHTVQPPPSVVGPGAQAFVAADVSYLRDGHGWAIGSVGCGTRRCVAVLGTSDRGRTWTRLASPGARLGPGGSTSCPGCVSSIRFADDVHGYAYGDAFYATDDGGRTWQRQPAPPVVAVATSGRSVIRVVHPADEDCSACTFTVQTGTVGSTRWSNAMAPALQGIAAQVITSGRDVYVGVYRNVAGGVEARSELLVSTDNGTTWRQRDDPCGTQADAAAQHERDTTRISAAPDGTVAVLCYDRNTGNPSVRVSHDNAKTFSTAQQFPAAVSVVDIAAASQGLVASGVQGRDAVVLLATGTGGWRTVLRTPQPDGTVLGRLAFTTAQQGSWTGPIGSTGWTTDDSGQTWQLTRYGNR